MSVRKFTCANIHEAVAVVKSEMGENAVILAVRTIRDHGAPALEVTASLDPKHQRQASEVKARFEEKRHTLAVAGASVELPPPGAVPPVGEKGQGENIPRLMLELQEMMMRLERLQNHLNPTRLDERLESFAQDLGRLQELVRASGGHRPEMPVYDEDLNDLYEILRQSGMDTAYAQNLIEHTSRSLSSKSLAPAIYGMEYLASTLMDQVRTSTPLAAGREQQIHMFVGPTGVGKTTTIAKLAARRMFEEKRSVVLLTVDTFRIGAVDQLRTYARILDAPLEVCMNQKELVEAVRRYRDKDTIFIDTAGASQKDASLIGELARFPQAGVPMDVHLIVSATTSDADLVDIASRYGVLPLSSLIVTKLDEANHFGNVFNLMQQTSLPLSFFTVGQNVPDDIEPATPERVADLLLRISSRLDAAKCA